jgi:hypothetical protein
MVGLGQGLAVYEKDAQFGAHPPSVHDVEKPEHDGAP